MARTPRAKFPAPRLIVCADDDARTDGNPGVAGGAWDGQAGILNGRGTKPKRMRWRTFERLEAQYSDLQRRAMHAMMVKLERLCRTVRGSFLRWR